MANETQYIEVMAPGGGTLLVEAIDLDGGRGGGEALVAGGLPDFEPVMDTVTKLAKSFQHALEQAKPKKAAVEFGVKVAVKSGTMTSLFVNAAGEAAIKITLEWGG
ncbi:CU044_2847 family protein [Kitasatospora sp. NPDC058162]|uniref:CU044_2847 family protein n=1 Tax=Kitasatospora sp. NPDC058162 TaxID=3346362 RepID=UPI0036DB34DF